MAWTQWICSTDGVEIITIEINLDFRWKCEVYSQSVNIQYPLLIVHILSEQTSEQKNTKNNRNKPSSKKKYKKQSNNKKYCKTWWKRVRIGVKLFLIIIIQSQNGFWNYFLEHMWVGRMRANHLKLLESGFGLFICSKTHQFTRCA